MISPGQPPSGAEPKYIPLNKPEAFKGINFHEQMKILSGKLAENKLDIKNPDDKFLLNRAAKYERIYKNDLDSDHRDTFGKLNFGNLSKKDFNSQSERALEVLENREELIVSARITKRSASVGGEITRGGQKIKEELGKALSDFEKSTKDLDAQNIRNNFLVTEARNAEILLETKSREILDLRQQIKNHLDSNQKLKNEKGALEIDLDAAETELLEIKKLKEEVEGKIKELENSPKVNNLDTLNTSNNPNTLAQTPGNNINFQDVNDNYKLALEVAKTFKNITELNNYTRDIFLDLTYRFKNANQPEITTRINAEKKARDVLGFSFGPTPNGIFDEKNGNKNTFAGVMNERFKELQSQAILDTEQKSKSVYQTRTATNKPLDVDDASRYQGVQDNNSDEEAREDQIRRLFNFKNDIKQTLLKGETFNLAELRRKYSISNNAASRVLAEIKNEAQAELNKTDLKPEVKIESAQPQPQQNLQSELPTINSVSGEIGKLESDLDILQLDFKEGAINSGIKTNAEVFKKGLREMLARVGVISGNISAIPPKKSKPFNELKPVRKMGQSEELYKQKVKEWQVRKDKSQENDSKSNPNGELRKQLQSIRTSILNSLDIKGAEKKIIESHESLAASLERQELEVTEFVKKYKADLKTSKDDKDETASIKRRGMFGVQRRLAELNKTNATENHEVFIKGELVKMLKDIEGEVGPDKKNKDLSTLTDFLYTDTKFVLKIKDVDGKDRVMTPNDFRKASEGENLMGIINPFEHLFRHGKSIAAKVKENKWFQGYPHSEEGEIQKIKNVIGALEIFEAKLRDPKFVGAPNGLLYRMKQANSDSDGQIAKDLDAQGITSSVRVKFLKVMNINELKDPFAKEIIDAVNGDKIKKELLKRRGLSENDINLLMANMHKLNDEAHSEIFGALQLKKEKGHGLIDQLQRSIEDRSYAYKAGKLILKKMGYKNYWARNNADPVDEVTRHSIDNIINKLRHSDKDGVIRGTIVKGQETPYDIRNYDESDYKNNIDSAPDLSVAVQDKPASKNLIKKFGWPIFGALIASLAIGITAHQSGKNSGAQEAYTQGVTAQKAVDQVSINELNSKKNLEIEKLKADLDKSIKSGEALVLDKPTQNINAKVEEISKQNIVATAPISSPEIKPVQVKKVKTLISKNTQEAMSDPKVKLLSITYKTNGEIRTFVTTVKELKDSKYLESRLKNYMPNLMNGIESGKYQVTYKN